MEGTVEEMIKYFLSEILKVPVEYIQFPHFIFFLIIPYLFVVYCLFDLLTNKLKIFRSGGVNIALAALITFSVLKFVYPTFFIISILYIIVVKRFVYPYLGKGELVKEFVIKFGILIVLFLLYFWLLPYILKSFGTL